MSEKQFLPLPCDYDSFEKIRKDNCYFVDKSSCIRNVLNNDPYVTLFTRPKGFGKTVFMSMLNSFLSIDKDHPFDTSLQQKLFSGTEILKDTEFCEKYMGKFPVIFISLKDVYGNTFEDAYRKFAETVSQVASRYEYLLNSKKLNKNEKQELKELLDEEFLKKTGNKVSVQWSLKTLASLLYKEYEKLPVLLMDEYDVPLKMASQRDAEYKKSHNGEVNTIDTSYYRMATMMSGFLDILKDNLLKKIVMTGSLKFIDTSLITGANNIYYNTVTSTIMDLTGIFGFTKDDTLKALKDYDLSAYSELVKENYGGYRFDDKEMYCPLDVINFIEDNYKNNLNGHKEPVRTNSYWFSSTSSSDIYEHIAYLTDKDTQNMQDLVDGKSISFELNGSTNYAHLSEHNPDDFWSLLLHTGYLTVDWDSTKAQTDKSIICARIPNQEILDCFVKNIKNKFRNELTKDNTAQTLVNSLFEGKSEEVSDILFDLLQNYVSVRDTATKAPHENYYHGFLNGLFSNCKDIIKDYQSNAESGDGYADITFKSQRGNSAVIIEIKVVSKDDLLDDYTQKALNQIDKMNYAASFLKVQRIKNILAYGISFCRKDCSVALKQVK